MLTFDHPLSMDVRRTTGLRLLDGAFQGVSNRRLNSPTMPNSLTFHSVSFMRGNSHPSRSHRPLHTGEDHSCIRLVRDVEIWCRDHAGIPQSPVPRCGTTDMASDTWGEDESRSLRNRRFCYSLVFLCLPSDIVRRRKEMWEKRKSCWCLIY